MKQPFVYYINPLKLTSNYMYHLLYQSVGESGGLLHRWAKPHTFFWHNLMAAAAAKP
jgi:hypothetical protein